MKRFIFTVLFFCSAAPALASEEYVFILSSRGNPFWQAAAQGIEDAGKEKGIKPLVMMVADDRASEEQLNDCENAIIRKPKVIVMASLSPASGMQCFKHAQEKGIVLGDMDANITVEDAKKENVNLAFSVGSDNLKVGQDAATYVSKNFPAESKILVIEGAPGSATGRKRVEGFSRTIRIVMPKAVIIASTSGDWDRLKAMTLTTDTLQRVPDLAVIYAANDTMALGAAESVKAAKKSVAVIGVDGIEEARKAVLEGRMAATVAQLPYLMGRRAVELAIEAANGKPQNENVITPTPVLDTNLLKAHSDPVLQYVR